MLSNQKNLPMALDLGTSRVRLLQLRRQGEDYRVEAAAATPLPSGLAPEGPEFRDALTEAIRGVLRDASARGRQCVLGLPDAMAHYKNVRMPKMPPDELAQAVVFEARDRFEFKDPDAVIQHISAGEVVQGEEHRQEMIVMAVTDAVMRQVLGAVEQSSLSPIAIETAPTALARCFARLVDGEEDQKVRVYVDIGYSGSKVMLMRGTQITFYKRIDIGGRALNEAIAKHLELPLDEAAKLRARQTSGEAQQSAAGEGPLFGSTRRQNVDRAVFEATRPLLQELAKEIGLCMRYYAVTFRGKRAEEALLCGGESTDTELTAILADQLDLPVAAIDPFFGVQGAEAVTGGGTTTNGAAWAVAMGLALRQPFATHGLKRGAA